MILEAEVSDDENTKENEEGKDLGHASTLKADPGVERGNSGIGKEKINATR